MLNGYPRPSSLRGKHYIQQAYEGRLEWTDTLAQGLTGLRQRTFDTKTQRATYLLVQELHQRYQFLLVEIKHKTNPADILNSINYLYKRSAKTSGQSYSLIYSRTQRQPIMPMFNVSQIQYNMQSKQRKTVKPSLILQTEQRINHQSHTTSGRLPSINQDHERSLLD